VSVNATTSCIDTFGQQLTILTRRSSDLSSGGYTRRRYPHLLLAIAILCAFYPRLCLGSMAIRGLGFRLLRPPFQQSDLRGFEVGWAFVQPEVQQVVISTSDQGPGFDTQNFHDLFAVEVRTDRGEFLFFGQLLDAVFQIVISGCQATSLTFILGRHI